MDKAHKNFKISITTTGRKIGLTNDRERRPTRNHDFMYLCKFLLFLIIIWTTTNDCKCFWTTWTDCKRPPTTALNTRNTATIIDTTDLEQFTTIRGNQDWFTTTRNDSQQLATTDIGTKIGNTTPQCGTASGLLMLWGATYSSTPAKDCNSRKT